MTSRGFAAWVEVDLARLRANFQRLSELSPAAVAPVLKTDAYGHGAVEAARILVDAGAELLIVARADEAVTLREAGVDGRLLVLAPPDATIWPALVEHQLEVTCSTAASFEFLLEAAAAEPHPVHVKFNTGMNRLGIPEAGAGDVLAALDRAGGVRPVAVCSHLADADVLESERTADQVQRFRQLFESLPARFRTLETHLGNSAGLLHHDLGDHSFVRLGLALYGYDPAGAHDLLEPVMSVHARVLAIHDLEPGQRVGYGGRWAAGEPTRVATIGVGYGDGYARHQTGHPRVLTDAGARPIVGAVSMDLLSFGLTPGDAIQAGDTVTLLGKRAGESVDAHELAANAETIAYEVLLRFGRRLPVVYRGW